MILISADEKKRRGKSVSHTVVLSVVFIKMCINHNHGIKRQFQVLTKLVKEYKNFNFIGLFIQQVL